MFLKKFTFYCTVLFFSFTTKIAAYEVLNAKTEVSPGGIGSIVSQSSVSSIGTPLPEDEELMNVSSEWVGKKINRALTQEKERTGLELSDYVTIVITVPETHADVLREAMGRAGAGKIGNYSHCSYTTRGIGRFMPNQKSDPCFGKEGVLEEVIEERIEVPCARTVLQHVVDEIKKAHPYEQPMIAIFPFYELQED